MMNSKYYDDLDAVAQRRYRQKLEISGLPSSVFSRAFRGGGGGGGLGTSPPKF